VEVLLAHGADVDAKNNFGETALMWAARDGHTSIVQALLGKGADVNWKHPFAGDTALFYAAAGGHTAIVKALLAHDALVNAQDRFFGFTALMAAVMGGHADTVGALLAHGADVNAQDNRGRTALMHAGKRGLTGVVQLLKKAGAEK
jgi:ankyrin repeat protein